MSGVPHKGSLTWRVHVQTSHADPNIRPWPSAPLWSAVTNGVRKRAGTSCDHDRLREGARLVTYS